MSIPRNRRVLRSNDIVIELSLKMRGDAKGLGEKDSAGSPMKASG
jgi:hypothetical protein